MPHLSTELQQFFFAPERPPQVTLADILELAGERTFGFLFVLLAFPSALPVPAPGYSIPFGILIFLLAVQLATGAKRPWLPDRIQRQSVDLQKVQGILQAGLPWLQRIEAVSRPRMSYLCTSFAGRTLLGTAIALMAVSMMIPIPGTNTLPAIGVFVTGFGLLDDDGAISLGGLTLCVIAGILSASIIIGVMLGGASLLDFLRQWFQTLR